VTPDDDVTVVDQMADGLNARQGAIAVGDPANVDGREQSQRFGAGDRQEPPFGKIGVRLGLLCRMTVPKSAEGCCANSKYAQVRRVRKGSLVTGRYCSGAGGPAGRTSFSRPGRRL
jgi:hypothetical protein